MNILFLYRVFPCYGGVEVVTTVLANEFVKDGHNVCIASFEQPNMELLDKLSSGIDLITLDYSANSRRNAKKLHHEIISRDIDLIINQWGLPYKTTMLCNRAIHNTKCKLVSVLHGSPYTSKVILTAQDKIKESSNNISKAINYLIYRTKDEIIRWSIRYNVKHNEKYILLSNGFKESLLKYARISDSPAIIAISNPITIDVDYLPMDLTEKKKQLLYVGRMDFINKRVNRIIEVWQELFKDYPDWELVLVGDGPHKQNLIDYVSEHKIERVRFEGFQVEPPIKFYKDASLFILTSDLEGFGLVLTECMSYGVVPIAYGSYEAVFDIIDDGKSGYITPTPYSKEITKKHLIKLIENKQLLNEMANAAIEKSKEFIINSIKEEWYKLFSQLN
ncbi:glycosyltransferase [Marinifilum sp. RC60d5]|uniref:glycosyltransferase n=1 Tax=Marinifilum sp. RC60d5 TaxID=3458414 RepID=UPI0040365CD1